MSFYLLEHFLYLLGIVYHTVHCIHVENKLCMVMWSNTYNF